MRNDLGLGQGRWKTFPERLEEAGVSWRIYQNDVSCGGGFVGEERSWLTNFGCNPLERFERYNVRFTSRYLIGYQNQLRELPKEIGELRAQLTKLDADSDAYKKAEKALEKKADALAKAKREVRRWAAENFDKLSQTEQNLFHNAFTTNQEDPDFRSLDILKYTDEAGICQPQVPNHHPRRQHQCLATGHLWQPNRSVPTRRQVETRWPFALHRSRPLPHEHSPSPISRRSQHIP